MDWENQELIKSLLEVFDRTCRICHANYDLKVHIPMMLCLSQHICCQICIYKHMAKFQENECTCPICRVSIKKSDVMKVRRFDAVIEFYERYELICKDKSEEKYLNFKADLKTNINSYNNRRWLANLQEKQGQIASLYNFMMEQATKFFKERKITRAIEILQQILMNFQDRNDKFIGLGSKEQAQGYYGDVQKWFERVYAKEIISAFDLLGLCFLAQRSYNTTHSQKDFYLKLAKKSPTDYRVWFGLALVQHNNQKFKEAASLYWKVVEMQAGLDKPYEMLAFIQLQYKSNNENARRMAQEALLRNPKNLFAHYIMAVSLSDKQQKLVHLNAALQEDNLYGRAKHQLGILQIQMHQDHKSAQTYFQQCLRIDPEFHLARINLAKSLIAINKHKQALQKLMYFDGKKEIAKYLCYYIGKAFADAGESMRAIEFLSDSGIQSCEMLGDLYFKEGQFYSALQQFGLIKTTVDSEQYRILMKIGQCNSKLKRYSNAKYAYQKALKISKNPEQLQKKIAMLETMDVQTIPPKSGVIRSNTSTKKNQQNSCQPSGSRALHQNYMIK